MKQLCRNLFFLICALVTVSAAEDQIILFTGNTLSYIEPCGCVDGMLGGIVKRPRAYEGEKDYVLLDSGAFISIENELDRVRNRHYMSAYPLLGYQAVGLAERDASESREFLNSLETADIFVASNLLGAADNKPVFATERKVGAYLVVSLLSGKAEVHKDFKVSDPLEKAGSWAGGTEKMILLSDLSPEELPEVVALLKERLVLVIANRSRGDFSRIEGVPVVHPGQQGKLVKKYVPANGAYSSLPVEESFESVPELVKIIDEYMEDILNNPEMQVSFGRDFEDYELEQQVLSGKNAYVGSENCRDCHKPEYESYINTRHAKAMDSLLQSQRDFHPDCVRCHTVGFGYPTGYEIRSRQAWLNQVGCESCHGPGLMHYKNPSTANTMRRIEKRRCEVCHDEENSPHFDYDEYLPKADHTVLAEVVTELVREKKEKVDLDLYVMSQCPYGTRAGNTILPLVKKYAAQINFRMLFIATDVEEEMRLRREQMEKDGNPPAAKKPDEPSSSSGPGCNASFELDPYAKFQSLHGQPEVDENIRQLLVEEFYGQQKQFEYVLERNKNIYGDWKLAALKNGIDVQKIEKAMTDGSADDLFRKNIAHANANGVTASPTIFINGQRYNMPVHTVPVEYAVCNSLTAPPEFCKTAPECSADEHCVRPGKRGVCENSGTSKAACTFTEPVPVPLVIIRDSENCPVCETGPFLKRLYQMFQGLEVRIFERQERRAQNWIKRFKVDRFPFYFFETNEVEEDPAFRNLSRAVVKVDGVWTINPLLHEVAVLDMPERNGNIKLYTNPLSRGVTLQKDLLDVIDKMPPEKREKVNFELVNIVNQSRSTAKHTTDDDRLMVELSDAQGRTQSLYLESYYGRREIEESLHQICISRHTPENIYHEYLRQIAVALPPVLGELTDRNALKKKLNDMDYNAFVQGLYVKSGITPEMQKPIRQCVISGEGGSHLVQGFMDVIDKKVVASPTLLINNVIYVRGVTPTLLEMLPDFID